MLTEQRPLSADHTTRIYKLRLTGFHAIQSLPMPRGTYLAYENYLIETIGPEAGSIHTGRSRNDLKATVLVLKLRDKFRVLARELMLLQATLLGRARYHRDIVRRAYTHFQPAVPVTYGYYLLGIATAIDRDITGLVQSAQGLRVCPLGAAAVRGTDLPIDPQRTAQLLGSDEPALHTMDAVASRDIVLRILASAGILGITLSRLATDLQLWSSSEFGMITLHDLVGSSSAMPQKRNAFLFEHAKGKAGLIIGAWTGAASAMKGTPFTKSIEVGTESVRVIGETLTAVTESVVLSRLLVARSQPVPGRMRKAAETGYTAATALANNMVRIGIPFRSAHKLVGTMICQAIANGRCPLSDVATECYNRLDVGSTTDHRADRLDIESVASRTKYGGGPGPQSFTHIHNKHSQCWTERVSEFRHWIKRVDIAADELDRATEKIRTRKETAVDPSGARA
jgi:argininosuccinate lyase